MPTEMSPDRQERHDALKEFEEKLTNGHRGDVGTMSDCIVEMSRSFRIVLKTTFVKPDELKRHCADEHQKLKPSFGWPVASSIVFVTCAIVGLVFRFVD